MKGMNDLKSLVKSGKDREPGSGGVRLKIDNPTNNMHEAMINGSRSKIEGDLDL